MMLITISSIFLQELAFLIISAMISDEKEIGICGNVL